MLKVTPNLHFRGQAKEAIELYKKAFGAEVKVLYTNADAHPDDIAQEEVSRPEIVYHCELYIGGQRLTLSDDPEAPMADVHPISLLITFETANDAKQAYEIMKDGATIIYPVQTTTYSSFFVSLIDRFGIRWELMTEQTDR